MVLHPCKACAEPSVIGLDGLCTSCRLELTEWYEQRDRAIEAEDRFTELDRLGDRRDEAMCGDRGEAR